MRYVGIIAAFIKITLETVTVRKLGNVKQLGNNIKRVKRFNSPTILILFGMDRYLRHIDNLINRCFILSVNTNSRK